MTVVAAMRTPELSSPMEGQVSHGGFLEEMDLGLSSALKDNLANEGAELRAGKGRPE